MATAPLVFISGLIVISYVPGHYVFLMLLIFTMLSAAPQMITYKHFKDLWLKEAFAHSKEPEELLRMLKKTLLIKEAMTLDYYEARYKIDIQRSNPDADQADLPEEIHIHKKRGIALAVAIVCVIGSAASIIGALVSEEYVFLIFTAITSITAIVMIRRYKSQYPRVIISNEKIVINDIALPWEVVERYLLSYQGNSGIELTLFTYLNKQLSVSIDYPNLPHYAVEYYMNKYSS